MGFHPVSDSMELSVFQVLCMETFFFKAIGTQDSRVHGPCTSGRFQGTLDNDIAHSLISEFWPPCASSWSDRCHSWPLSHVVDTIIKGGCHVVAIGHKFGKHAGRTKTCLCTFVYVHFVMKILKLYNMFLLSVKKYYLYGMH